MSETVEIQMARLQEQIKTVIKTLAEDREDRKERDKTFTQIAVNMGNFDRRLEAVEKQLAADAPTIQEYLITKQRVIGAGLFGKWIWLVGGFAIALIYSSREAIRNYFMH